MRAHREHLDPLLAVDRVEDCLEVGPLAGDQNRDPVAHAATDAGGTCRTGYGPPLVASRFCSINSTT